MLANRKNQVNDSIQLLEPLLPAIGSEYTTRNAITLCTLADDYAKAFQYGQAADTYRLLTRLQGYREEAGGCKAARQAERWELLRGAAKQTANVASPFALKGTPTGFGPIEVQVQAANFSDLWVVDTGANLSAVTRTVAEQLGLNLRRPPR